MSKLIVGLYAETFLHPGSGQNEGAIDLPVMREKVTAYPVVLGSSLKGALRAKAVIEQSEQVVNDYFGKQEGAGGILVGDARLLLLPIRSLTSSFKWLSCQHVIKRLQRDLARCGAQPELTIPTVEVGTYADAGQHDSDNQAPALYLEERRFEASGTNGKNSGEDSNKNSIDDTLLELIASTMPNNIDISELRQRLIIVHDDDFTWFCGNSLPIHARNVLNQQTKASENLWYEETLPPETVLYSVLLPRFDAKMMTDFKQQVIENNPYLQIGGNETIGQGWVAMTIAPQANIAPQAKTSPQATKQEVA